MDIGYWLASFGAAGGIFAGVKAIPSVREGQRGVRTTLGRASRTDDGKIRVLTPQKFVPIFPFVQKIHTVHMEENTIHFSDMRITLKNTLSYTFDSFLSYSIEDTPEAVESVIFKLEDAMEYVGLNFKLAVQSALYQYDDTPEKMKTIGKDIKDELEKLIRGKGFKINQCGIVNLSETPTAQASRSVDYRIQAAVDHLGTEKLPECVLAACLGATPVVSPNDCFTYEATEQ